MRKYVILLLVTVVLSIGTILYFGNKERKDYVVTDAILYSWNLEKVLQDKEKFYSVLDQYKIYTLYQDFSSEYLKNMDASFISEMANKNIDVYHLAGDPSWGKKDGVARIKKEIDKVVLFNAKAEHSIKGIILDIEPYVSEKETKFAVTDFKTYVEQIEQAYQYISDKNLELRLAIPHWFDSIDISLLEELIKNSDGVSVMNYNIEKTSKNIQNEVILAKKYNKQIDTIYEIEYDDEDYFSSHQEILEDFRNVRKDNDLSSLQISYHHYGSIN